MTRVSIVVPCYNDGAHLLEALDSAVQQTHSEVEILVIDDGSTDHQTQDVLAGLDRGRFVVLSQDNRGVSAARNAAIERCTGDFVLPLDADDVLGPTYIANAVEILNQRPEVGIVGSRTEFFGRASAQISPEVPRPVDWLFANQLPASAVFRRSDWHAVGGYPESLSWGEDWVFWVRLVARGAEVAVLPEVGLLYRRRRGQVTERVAWTVREETRALVLTAGAKIARDHESEFATRLAQQLNLLEALRIRYRSTEWALGNIARLVRRRGSS